MEKTGCKIICGAPMTLAVKGLMMMMMMRDLINANEMQTGNVFSSVLCQLMDAAILKINKKYREEGYITIPESYYT